MDDLIVKEKEFKIITTVALALVLIGTVFYHFVEKLTWLDSFYFCVITLTTVGYGDISPETSIGKLFTAFYVLIGIGTIGVFINYAAKRRFNRKVNKINKKRS